MHCCISFDSYIKPQLWVMVIFLLLCCISFDSYIKPQQGNKRVLYGFVVYLLIPTSNHNMPETENADTLLYIFWFLHQTTTVIKPRLLVNCCISFDSYIKPQPGYWNCRKNRGCISFDSYIKPQLGLKLRGNEWVVYLLIPTSNHNSPKDVSCGRCVVYLLIPTSNHNLAAANWPLSELYIFWFLHQTTTWR